MAGGLRIASDSMSLLVLPSERCDRTDLQRIADETVRRLLENELRSFDQIRALAAVNTATAVAELDGTYSR